MSPPAARAELLYVPEHGAPEAQTDDLAFPDKRSTARGLGILAVHGAIYLATLFGALAPLPLWANIIFALGNGVMIALLFIIAHDGAHGAFVPGRKMNIWIARFAFIPCVHAASLWCTIHNKLHHGYTNLKGMDGVWEPMSKAEYDAASLPRRILERIFRGPLGPFVYYYWAFWPHMTLLPLGKAVRMNWPRHLSDSVFAISGFAVTITLIVAAGEWLTPERPLWLVLLVGWVIPYTVWNYLMAFTTYLNHTHPAIVWFDDMAMWRRHHPNLLDTANVRMPFPLNRIALYDKVMSHTAHHVQTTAPVYALPDMQAGLNSRFTSLVDYKFSIREYFRILRVCKLYDFERRCWVNFRGVPTS
jgi:acyl-lipid omega-6 desaturase (Delta-12 desaturase)